MEQIQLGEIRQRNAERKGRTKQDIDLLLQLAEELHNGLVRLGHHSEECRYARALHGESTPCCCGLDELGERIAFDFRTHSRRKHGENIPLAQVYEDCEVKR